MRLIDADKLLEKAEIIGYDHVVFLYDVINAPTVDAEPVVKCKDCIYKYVEAECWRWGFTEFCSRGQRREDEID